MIFCQSQVRIIAFAFKYRESLGLFESQTWVGLCSACGCVGVWGDCLALVAAFSGLIIQDCAADVRTWQPVPVWVK